MIERVKLEKFFSYISKFRKVVLLGHVNPDGDSVGSLAGMADFLTNNGIEPVCVVPSAYPGFLSFLDKNGKILVYGADKDSATGAVESAELITLSLIRALSLLVLAIINILGRNFFIRLVTIMQNLIAISN